MLKIRHWKIKRFFLKIRKTLFPTPQEELINLVINESINNPVKDGSREYKEIMERIATELKKDKNIITVINGELVEIGRSGNKISIEKIRPKSLRKPSWRN